MNTVIRQRLQPPSNEPIWSLISGSSIALEFQNPEIITNTFRPHAITWGMKYFQYKETIEGFSNLKQNWDSYNADTISQIAITKAIKTLDLLNSKGLLENGITINVFPMRDGGIQFEFDGKSICAELEISPDGDTTFILFDNDGVVLKKESIFELSELPTFLEEAQYA